MNVKLHPHTQNLANFYTQSAYKRHHTRRRSWPEFEYIADYINQIDQVHLTILELGCGDGRLYSYLVEHCPSKVFRYTGVDVSSGLIDLAQQNHLGATWICGEMLQYLELIPQQSCDIIIGIASIQHLPTRQQQILFFHEAYRVLNYEGSLMMTNRSLSHWFIKRHRKPLILSIGKSIGTLGRSDWRNVMLPFTDGDTTSHRFYHLFARKRLSHLLRVAGFAVIKACFISSSGEQTQNWETSRNHFHIARKQVRLA